MNEKLQEQLAVFVEKAIAVAEKTGEFAVDQAPDLLREFYTWAIVEDVFFIVLGIGIFFLGRYLPCFWTSSGKKGYSGGGYYFRRYDESPDFDHKSYVSGAITSAWMSFGIGVVVSSSLILVNTFDLLKVLVSPKLYLIEHFMEFVK